MVAAILFPKHGIEDKRCCLIEPGAVCSVVVHMGGALVLMGTVDDTMSSGHLTELGDLAMRPNIISPTPIPRVDGDANLCPPLFHRVSLFVLTQ